MGRLWGGRMSFSAYLIGILSQKTGMTKLTVNATEVIGGPHINFPILVNLADMPQIFWSVVRNGGEDIRCYSDVQKTIQLAREVVSCETGSKAGELWVKIPSLSSSTTFYIDVDGVSNEPAPDSTYGRENVWTNNYLAVWHMGESSGISMDSTMNNNDGIFGGNLPDQRSGKIGNSQHFDGNADYINIGNSLSPLDDFTVSAWVKPDAISIDKQIISKGFDGTNTQWELKTTTEAGKISFQTYDNPNGLGVESINTITTNWNYIVASYGTSSDWKIYLTGTLDNSSNDSGPVLTSEDLQIGAVYAFGSPGFQSWEGLLDEVRISNTVRSSDWIKTEYNNQSDSSAFWIVQ
ncbi:LamG domain-containing protein [Rhodohalobacter sp. 614A]|uniref:LamG domain-containing protein n=1 Tax=Rhodohalobacter sp. 614A TaxID=2908649 RepID=UPI001F3EF46E|nr:LamG domain-containing protein [Rhodohalobacter sp. 614A]